MEARRADGGNSRAPADADGNYAFTIRPSERADLFASDGEHSAYRLGFQPSGEREQRLDWPLTETGAAANGSQQAAPNAPSNRNPPSLAAPNRVLQLDGNGSFVELPAGCFSNLAAITVEGWGNWASFRFYSHYFEFGFAKAGDGEHRIDFGRRTSRHKHSLGILHLAPVGWLLQSN